MLWLTLTMAAVLEIKINPSLPLSFSLSLPPSSHHTHTHTHSHSGNVVIETMFYNGTTLVSTSKVRLFYVWTSTHVTTCTVYTSMNNHHLQTAHHYITYNNIIILLRNYCVKVFCSFIMLSFTWFFVFFLMLLKLFRHDKKWNLTDAIYAIAAQ